MESPIIIPYSPPMRNAAIRHLEYEFVGASHDAVAPYGHGRFVSRISQRAYDLEWFVLETDAAITSAEMTELLVFVVRRLHDVPEGIGVAFDDTGLYYFALSLCRACSGGYAHRDERASSDVERFFHCVLLFCLSRYYTKLSITLLRQRQDSGIISAHGRN